MRNPFTDISIDFSQEELTLVAVGMRIASERFEKDAANEHMPERLRQQFATQARMAAEIVDRIENPA